MQSVISEAEKYSIWPQIYATIAASMSMTASGSVIGWMSPAMNYLSDPDSGYNLDYGQISWIASIIYLGQVAGPLITVLFVDKIGRKKTLLTASFFHIIGWIVAILSQNFVQLMIARIVMGVGNGISTSTCPLYVAEISENKRRGALLTVFGSCTTIGMLYSSIIGPRTTLQEFNLSALCIPILFIAMFIFVPESPYYFEKTGRRKHALKSLVWLRGVKREDSVLKEIESVSIFVKTNITFGFFDTFKEMSKKNNLKILALVAVMFFGQQFAGTFAITSYAEKIFRDVNSPLNPPEAVVLLLIVSLISYWIALPIVDRGGRKLLLLISCAGTCAANLLIGSYLYLSQDGIVDTSFSWMAMVGIFGFKVAASFGLNTIPFILLSEMFPSATKSWCVCIICVYLPLLAFAVTKLFQVIDSGIGGFCAFYLFAFSMFITSLYIYFFMPETKRMSFNEIQEKLNESTK